jgi:hypothetical protein
VGDVWRRHLAEALGLAVYVRRIVGRVLAVAPEVPREDAVRGDLDDPRPAALRGVRERVREAGIDVEGRRHLCRAGRIDVRLGDADGVHDPVGAHDVK